MASPPSPPFKYQIYNLDPTSTGFIDATSVGMDADKFKVFLSALRIIQPEDSTEKPTLLMLRGKQESLISPAEMVLTSIPLVLDGSLFKLDANSDAFKAAFQDLSGDASVIAQDVLSNIEISGTINQMLFKGRVGSLIKTQDIVLIPPVITDPPDPILDFDKLLKVALDGTVFNLPTGGDVPELATIAGATPASADITIFNTLPPNA